MAQFLSGYLAWAAVVVEAVAAVVVAVEVAVAVAVVG